MFWRRPAIPDNVFADLDREKLLPITHALYQFAQLAVASHRNLILSPSSPKAKVFTGHLESIGYALEGKADKVRGYLEISDELETKVEAFAEWQSDEYDRLVNDFARSLEKIVEALGSSTAANELIGTEMARVEANLRKTASSNSIEEMRANLAEQAATLHNVVKQQAAMQDHMKRERDATVDLLSAQLKHAENRGRTDSLTNLPNREGFDREILTAFARFRQGQGLVPFCLAIADLDGFKRLNDTLGHPAGDACLIAFAKFLRETFAHCAYVARLGGDEFVVLYRGKAPELAEKLRKMETELLKRPIAYDGANSGLTTTISCSFGVAAMEHGDTLEALYKRADSMLYAMKRGGRETKVA